MKLPVVLLSLSLAANAALVAVYVSKKPATDPAAEAKVTASTSPKVAATPGEAAAATEAAHVAALAQSWTQLEGGDPATLVARLRAAGFSPAMIRAIVGAQIGEKYSARRKALVTAQEETPYWKAQRGFLFDPKTQAAIRALGREQMSELKALLGPDALGNNEEMQAFQRRQYGNLPREKIEQLQAVVSDYSELISEIQQKTNGIYLPEDREKLAYLEKEKLADLSKVLTPQELEDYQVRSSSTAMMLRSQLAGFNPTEAEFRALYRASAAAEEQFGSASAGNFTPDSFRKRQEALLAQAQSVLTPKRLAEYKQATDPQYQQINRLVARLELPPATSQQVVALQTDVQQRAAALRTNRTLTADDRNAQLAALTEEATTKLTTTLTPRGFEAYKTNGGFWLQNLQPRPAPTTTRPAPSTPTPAPTTAPRPAGG